MNDHDRRQLESMLHQIDAFRDGTIDLAWLVSSLESLRNAVQDLPEKWLDNFRAHWGILEEIYSVSVVREEAIPPAERAEVLRVVGEIGTMVSGLLSASPAEE